MFLLDSDPHKLIHILSVYVPMNKGLYIPYIYQPYSSGLTYLWGWRRFWRMPKWKVWVRIGTWLFNTKCNILGLLMVEHNKLCIRTTTVFKLLVTFFSTPSLLSTSLPPSPTLLSYNDRTSSRSLEITSLLYKSIQIYWIHIVIMFIFQIYIYIYIYCR